MKNIKLYKPVLFIIIFIATFIGFIAFYMSLTVIQEKLFINGDYMTLMIKSPYSYLVCVILMIIISIILESCFFKCRNTIKYILPIVIILIYIITTSVTVITNEGIYDYSFYDIKGKKYNFEQVKHVTTGFEDSGKHKGEFYYNIELDNGKKLKLAYPSMVQPSSKYDFDTWREYVDIDKYIMDADANKVSSENGKKYVSMDKIYVDKLLYVINNK